MKSREDRATYVSRSTVTSGLVCLLICCVGLMSTDGCSGNSSNGGGPEVLPKKYPGGGSQAPKAPPAGTANPGGPTSPGKQ